MIMALYLWHEYYSVHLCWPSEWDFIDVHVFRYGSTCSGTITWDDIYHTRGEASLQTQQDIQNMLQLINNISPH